MSRWSSLIIKSGDVINQGLSSASTINGYIVNETFKSTIDESNLVNENEDTSTNAPIDLGSQDSEFEIIDLKLDQHLPQ